MNVVIYARYSSDRQTEQSIEGQLKECYEYARRNGYTIVGEYIDRAISGTTDHRPEFLRMIADGDKKLFQAVLVYQLDRFARNRYDSATYKAKLKKNGIRVLSARENISDDASGVLMEAVLEGMAEYYSVELSQKIRRGMDINAEKCLSTGGNLALGFRVDSEKHIQIDPDTAPVVQKIFEMYASGQSMADIIRYLNANQIKTSYGNEFNKNSINRILRNKRYIGVYTYRDKEIPDGLPRIVDEDLFWEAQRIMEKNKKAPARAKAKVDYLLTTKLFCGHCKAAMTGISGTSKTERKYHYYQCVTNRRDKSCDKKTVGKEYIEDLVVNRLRDFLTPDNISTIAREVVDLCERESNNGNTRRLKKLLAENEQATENLLKALESGQAVDIIADRIAQKKKEHEKLSLQLLVETSQHPTPSVKEIRFFLNQFRKGDINDPKYRQGLVDMLVNKIYLYDDKMTVLCNTQDGHFDVDLKEVSSLKGQLVDFDPSNPNPFSLEGSMRKVLLWQEVKLYAVVMRKPSGSSHTVTEFTIRSMIMRRYLSSSIRPPLNSVNQ
ncbi:recombinase RecD [Oscillospiraceae bacterium]|nr:recombinase RecD [Oscillospiraceae bacterium]